LKTYLDNPPRGKNVKQALEKVLKLQDEKKELETSSSSSRKT